MRIGPRAGWRCSPAEYGAVRISPSTAPNGYSRLDPNRVEIEWTVNNPEPIVVE